VEIQRANAGSRSFVVNHLVFAVGIGGGTHNIPKIPGAVGTDLLDSILFISCSALLQEEFKGRVVHSGDYTKAKEYEGKKVVVVGACTSGMLSHSQSALDTLSFLSANDRPRHSKGPS
jgi:hypothetical protein